MPSIISQKIIFHIKVTTAEKTETNRNVEYIIYIFLRITLDWLKIMRKKNAVIVCKCINKVKRFLDVQIIFDIWNIAISEQDFSNT